MYAYFIQKCNFTENTTVEIVYKKCRCVLMRFAPIIDNPTLWSRLHYIIWCFMSRFLSMAEIGLHYDDVTMGGMASQITSLTIVYSTVYSVADQRKHQSPASLAFVRGIHRGPVNSPHKWLVTRKLFPFDDVILRYRFFSLPENLLVHRTGEVRANGIDMYMLFSIFSIN